MVTSIYLFISHTKSKFYCALKYLRALSRYDQCGSRHLVWPIVLIVRMEQSIAWRISGSSPNHDDGYNIYSTSQSHRSNKSITACAFCKVMQILQKLSRLLCQKWTLILLIDYRSENMRRYNTVAHENHFYININCRVTRHNTIHLISVWVLVRIILPMFHPV